MSRLILVILAIAALVLLVLLATGVLNVNQTREAKLPDVNISGGQAPVLDVDTNAAALNQVIEGAGNAADQAGDAVQNVNVPKVDVDVETQNQNKQ